MKLKEKYSETKINNKNIKTKNKLINKTNKKITYISDSITPQIQTIYKVTKDNLDQFRSELSLKSEPTQETYFIINNRFLSYTKGEISRQKIIEFLKQFSKNSIITAFYAIRFFHKATGIPFPIIRKDISPTGVKRIKERMATEDVIKFIKGANNYFGLIEIGYVCLSTIYAVRRSEMYDLNSNDINIEERSLLIYPKKQEEPEPRIHLIPEEIVQPMTELRDGLKQVKRKPHITEFNHLFDAICDKSNIELRPRMGWHSIRRCLISVLAMRHLDEKFINNFIRWKPRNPEIIEQYKRFSTEEFKQIDREIFEKHPFLKEWKPKKLEKLEKEFNSTNS
jgi:integrase